MFIMSKLYIKLSVSKETAILIRERCKEEFLKHNPKFIDLNITDDFIIKRVGDYYLNSL